MSTVVMNCPRHSTTDLILTTGVNKKPFLNLRDIDRKKACLNYTAPQTKSAQDKLNENAFLTS